MDTINELTLLGLAIPTPCVDAQRRIADYLDSESARIDDLIAKKRQIMQLVSERLGTQISSITIAGPQTQVRNLTSLRTSGPRNWAKLVSDAGAPFIRSANLQHGDLEIKTDNLVFVQPPATMEARRSAVRAGDVLVGITGANTGWVGCVGPNLAGAFVSQHVAILRPAFVEPQWLAYSLVSARAQDQLLGGQYGGTKQQLGLDDLAELRIAHPSPREQRRGVETMATAQTKSKKLIGLLDRQVRLLIEHRQALITAAITGELQLPGVAA